MPKIFQQKLKVHSLALLEKSARNNKKISIFFCRYSDVSLWGRRLRTRISIRVRPASSQLAGKYSFNRLCILLKCVVSQKLESCRCSDEESLLFFFRSIVLTLHLARDISDSEVKTLLTRREQIILGGHISDISDPTS